MAISYSQNNPTPEAIDAALGSGIESTSVEFKSAGTKQDLLGKVIKACLAFANRQDGGAVIIGVKEINGQPPDLTGLSEEELQTWKTKDLDKQLASYGDPPLSTGVSVHKYDGKDFLVVFVRGCSLVTVCKDGFKGEVNKGVVYFRDDAINESRPCGAKDLEEALQARVDQAIKGEIDRLIRQGILQINLLPTVKSQEFEDDMAYTFDQEAGDFL